MAEEKIVCCTVNLTSKFSVGGSMTPVMQVGIIGRGSHPSDLELNRAVERLRSLKELS